MNRKYLSKSNQCCCCKTKIDTPKKYCTYHDRNLSKFWKNSARNRYLQNISYNKEFGYRNFSPVEKECIDDILRKKSSCEKFYINPYRQKGSIKSLTYKRKPKITLKRFPQEEKDKEQEEIDYKTSTIKKYTPIEDKFLKTFSFKKEDFGKTKLKHYKKRKDPAIQSNVQKIMKPLQVQFPINNYPIKDEEEFIPFSQQKLMRYKKQLEQHFESTIEVEEKPYIQYIFKSSVSYADESGVKIKGVSHNQLQNFLDDKYSEQQYIKQEILNERKLTKFIYKSSKNYELADERSRLQLLKSHENFDTFLRGCRNKIFSINV